MALRRMIALGTTGLAYQPAGMPFIQSFLPSVNHLGGSLITPDGSRAYVASEQDNFVGVIDLQKLELTGRIQPGNGPDGMAWAVRK